jgi:hypothetical protein
MDLKLRTLPAADTFRKVGDDVGYFIFESFPVDNILEHPAEIGLIKSLFVFQSLLYPFLVVS